MRAYRYLDQWGGQKGKTNREKELEDLRQKLRLFEELLLLSTDRDTESRQRKKLSKSLDKVTQMNMSQLSLCVFFVPFAAWYVTPSAATAKNGASIIKALLKFLPNQATDILAAPAALFMGSFLSNFLIFTTGGIELAKQLGGLMHPLLLSTLNLNPKYIQDYFASFSKVDWLLECVFIPLNIIFTASQVGLASNNPFLLGSTEMALSILFMAYAFSNMNLKGFVGQITNKILKIWYGNEVENFELLDDTNIEKLSRIMSIVAKQSMVSGELAAIRKMIESLSLEELRKVIPPAVQKKVPAGKTPEVKTTEQQSWLQWGFFKTKQAGKGVGRVFTACLPDHRSTEEIEADNIRAGERERLLQSPTRLPSIQ